MLEEDEFDDRLAFSDKATFHVVKKSQETKVKKHSRQSQETQYMHMGKWTSSSNTGACARFF